MTLFPTRISGKLTLGGILLLFIMAFVIVAVMLWRGQPRVVEASSALIEKTGENIIRQLDSRMSRIEGETVGMARVAEVLPREETLYKQVIPQLIDGLGDPTIVGGGVWPEPDGFTPGVPRRSFFWARGDDGKLVYSDEYNDDSGPGYHQESWYSSAKTSPANQCVWSDVYQDPVSGVDMVTCSVPYHLSGQFAGVVTFDIQLDNLSNFMKDNGGSTSGYAFALDRQGQLLSFPQTDTRKTRTFNDLIKQSGWLAPVADPLRTMLAGNGATRTVALSNDALLDDASRIMLFSMPNTGWIIGLATPEDRVTMLSRTMMWDILGVLLPIMMILLMIAGFAVRHLIARLNATRVALDEIAQGDGDLTRRLTSKGQDELSAISASFNVFVDKLAGVLLNVKNSSEIVASNASGLAESNIELSSRITQQAAALAQSAAAMEQLNATVQQNATNTKLADELAEQTALTAQSSGDTMHEVVNTMDVINKSSTRMEEIVGVIDSIAFQTNILALNAAVEAARAGEQGRGFAVVASEVRVLAQRSATAAREIKDLIGESVSNVAIGSQRVRDAGDQLDDLVNNVRRVRQVMGEIRTAGEEQSKGISEVTLAVSQMESTIQQNASLIDESAARMQTLKEEAAQLVETVSTFKLSTDNASEEQSDSHYRLPSPGKAASRA